MKNIFKGSKTSLKILLAVVVLGLLYLGPGQIAMNSLRSSQEEVRQINSETEALNTRVANAKIVIANREEYESQIAAARNAIPVNEDLQGAIIAIENAARAAGISWTSGRPAAGQGSTSNSGYTISVAIEGNRQQAINFIEQLKASNRLMIVEGVNNLTESTSGQVTGTLTVRMFSLAQVR